MGAYPRSRGATVLAISSLRRLKGLSPLARGNLATYATALPQLGPIPARAGQPPMMCLGGRLSGAYPRSRGATRAVVRRRYIARGLSPLARGNPLNHRQARLSHGPIPARAGQPAA